jgi:hypothetical protein
MPGCLVNKLSESPSPSESSGAILYSRTPHSTVHDGYHSSGLGSGQIQLEDNGVS